MTRKQWLFSPREFLVGLLVLALVAYELQYLLIPFLVGAALAFVLTPVVDALARQLHLRRWMAVLVVFALSTAALAALAWWLVAAIVQQAIALANELPEILPRMFTQVFGSERFVLFGRTFQAHQLSAQILSGLESQAGDPTRAMHLLGVSFGLLMGGFLTLVLYFYFLLDGHRLSMGAIALLPPSRRQGMAALVARLVPMLRRYFAGLAVVVGVTAAISWLGIRLWLHMPRAELLAVATGVFELIPVVGPVLSAAVVGGAAVQRGGILLLVQFVAVYVVLRLVIDQVVGPIVLGRAAEVHPVVVLFAFLSGGLLFGPLGVLLAVPVAASLKIILASLYEEADLLDRGDSSPF